METNLRNEIKDFKEKYKANPAWYWLLFTAFSFFLLPEYISPFILFAAFIIFKRQWTREGRLAKVGNVGKIEMALMVYMLISTLWSPTKLDTLGCSGLWWGMFLMQVMIYNLAKTKERIKKVIEAVVASAAINGIIGAVQVITYILSVNMLLSKAFVLVTPIYRNLDAIVYKALPFKISTKMWNQRASGFFSNPNLLATFMLVAFPLAVFLYLNAESKKTKRLAFLSLICITAGAASTMTRAGCYVIIAEWALLFILFIKRHAKEMLSAAIPTFIFIVPSLLIRYGVIPIYARLTKLANDASVTLGDDVVKILDGAEAMKSSEAHLNIWRSMIDYITHHIQALIIGTGFGCEQTSNILKTFYNLKKPHSHNFIIEIWAELGVIGIVILTLIIVYTIGKMLEIDSKAFKSLTLVICLIASLGGFLIFGLSDYVFNSPKQIILFMMLIGLTQAVSYAYEKHEIHRVSDLSYAAKEEFKNIIHQ